MENTILGLPIPHFAIFLVLCLPIVYFGYKLYRAMAREEKQYQEWFDWVMTYGTEEQKQTALLIDIRRRINGLAAIAGLWWIIDD